ncbi:MAG: nitroreductase family protein [Pseudomonadota bacterium]
MAEITPAQAFLMTRRSRPLRTLKKPAPQRPVVENMLRMAARVPDHGKLEPWRFVVLEEKALRRVAERAKEFVARDDTLPSLAHSQFETSPFAVVVIESPKIEAKIPRIEQTYSTGAVCLGLVNAALASGFGANWLSGALSHDADFTAEAFGTQMHERVAGIVHIGSCDELPSDRPRPDIAAKTDWKTA